MLAQKSSVVAKELGVSYHRLMSLIRCQNLMPPPKDTSGDYLWSDQDVAAARKALASGRRGHSSRS